MNGFSPESFVCVRLSVIGRKDSGVGEGAANGTQVQHVAWSMFYKKYVSGHTVARTSGPIGYRTAESVNSVSAPVLNSNAPGEYRAVSMNMV